MIPSRAGGPEDRNQAVLMVVKVMNLGRRRLAAPSTMATRTVVLS